MTTKKSKRLFGVVPGVKTLITVSSFAATIIGWAWLTGQGATATQAANQPTNQPRTLSNTSPTTIPNTTTHPNHNPNNSSSFQQNQGSFFAPFTLRGITRSSR